MEKLPALSVRLVRVTLPEIEVTDTCTPGTAALSGPITLPRMMSVCCAARSRADIVAAANAARYNRRRTVTAPLLEWRDWYACGNPSTVVCNAMCETWATCCGVTMLRRTVRNAN